MRRRVVLVLVITLVSMIVGPPVSADVPVHPRPGRVALTFDDGPNPRWTPIVLEILAEYDVAATFFVNGFRVNRHPEIAQAIVADGHSLQSHTYGHENLPTLSNRTVEWTLAEGSRAIVEATGIAPTCVRPPYGSTSDRVNGIARSSGLEPVIWDFNTRDYAHQSASVAMSLASKIQDGDVVLMHDSIGWVWRDALAFLIEDIRSRGLGFDTICIARPDPASALRFGVPEPTPL